MKTIKLLFFAPALVMLLHIASCDKNDNPSSQTIYGKAVALGNDSVRSFVTLDAHSIPQTIGLQFGENALNGLPTDTMPGMPSYMFPLQLPDEAKITGADHLEVDWNPVGHAPTAIYGVPHFDFHFYYITQQEQAAVIPGTDTMPVAPQFIPTNYIVPVPIAVPYMGVHWFDSTASEFHGQPFTATFIYGFYHGEMTFLEPMITKAFLASHTNVTTAIKQPQAFQHSNYYPMNYELKYDAATHVYTLSLSGLTKHA
jgi:hypothetical protein